MRLFFLLAFTLDASATNNLPEHLWLILAYDHFLPNTLSKMAWFCKDTISYRQQWISLPLFSPLVCWGDVVSGELLYHTLGFESQLSWCASGWDCLKGRERGDGDARNCVTSTTATAQEKGAKEIYICLPINLNLDPGRSQRTVIYELSKPEKFLLTLYFQLLHAFLQDDSVIL